MTKRIGIEFTTDFAHRVQLVGRNDAHIRTVPGPMAEAMVAGGSAKIAHANGKVKSIKLIASADAFAHRVGSPSVVGMPPVVFCVREKLDCGAVVWRHHPRSMW